MLLFVHKIEHRGYVHARLEIPGYTWKGRKENSNNVATRKNWDGVAGGGDLLVTVGSLFLFECFLLHALFFLIHLKSVAFYCLKFCELQKLSRKYSPTLIY